MTLFLLLLYTTIYIGKHTKKQGWGDLRRAIRADDLDAVQKELRKKDDKTNGLPFTADHQGRTPLAVAIGFRQHEPSHLSIVDFLLGKDAKINMRCGRDVVPRTTSFPRVSSIRRSGLSKSSSTTHLFAGHCWGKKRSTRRIEEDMLSLKALSSQHNWSRKRFTAPEPDDRRQLVSSGCEEGRNRACKRRCINELVVAILHRYGKCRESLVASQQRLQIAGWLKSTSFQAEDATDLYYTQQEMRRQHQV